MKAEWCKISLFFLFVVAFIGTLLRLVAYVPIPFKYTNFVHAHSHTAFQGWVYLTMFLLLANTFLTDRQIEKKRYLLQFKLTIFIIFGVLVSFSLQGYGLYSIIFSTLYQLLNYWFIYSFLTDLKSGNYAAQNAISVKFIKSGLWFGLFSTLFPYGVGILSAKGTEAYHSFVYSFLHFQYNGWFLLVVLGLFFNYLDRNDLPYNHKLGNQFYWLMAVVVIPSLALSLLGMKFSAPLLPVATLSAIILGVALICFILIIRPLLPTFIRNKNTWFKLYFFAFLLSFILKIILQCLSIFPDFKTYAFSNKLIIVAYLHLSLIGAISFLFFSLLIEKKWLVLNGRVKTGSIFLLLGFATTEILLVLTGLGLFYDQLLLITGSAAMALGVLLMIISGSPKKIQYKTI
jgi:hypothetical protein